MPPNTTVTTQTRPTTTTPDLDALARRAPATDDLLALAAWLASNGPAHLSAIERIELAERLITRRRFLIGAGGLLGVAALGGCGAGTDESGDGDAAQEPTTEQRTITDDLGRSVLVPTTPQRIVALHDIQVMRPLLDLGVTPIAAATHPAEDGTFRFVEDYDVSGVETVGLIGEPNLETLVQIKPDLIIGTLSAQTDAFTDTMSEIAPTIVLDAGKSVIEHHQLLADVVGKLNVYNELMQEYETRLTRLREQIAPLRDDLLVSIFAFNPNAGQIQIAEGPYTLIFEGADIRQPEPQVDFESTDSGIRRYYISLEQLPEHDADIIFLLYWGDPAVNDPITTSAIWPTLQAVQANQVVEVNGMPWVVQTVRSLFNVIDAMEQHLVDTAIDTSVFP